MIRITRSSGFGVRRRSQAVQAFVLTVANLSNSSTLDNVSLSTDANLTVNSLSHNQSIDNVSLAQGSLLQVSDITQLSTIDSLTLDSSVTLTVNDILNSASIDGVELSQGNVLAVQEILQNQVIDGSLSLTSDATLNVGSITNTQTLENIVWIQLITPSDRIYLVGSDSTTYSKQ